MGRRRQQNPGPMVWGHRGASGDWPENTIPAFRKALEAGAEGLEFDLQKTADGRFVVIHDDRLERTTDGRGRVGDTTLAALKRLDAGRGESVPELGELLTVLSDFPGVTLNIELKEETLVPEDFDAINSALSDRSDTFRFHISSFRHDLLIPFARAG